MPQGGARGQKLGHLEKVFFYFSVMETTYADIWLEIQGDPNFDLRMNIGQHYLYFMV